jgi:hypothetical protein
VTGEHAVEPNRFSSLHNLIDYEAEKINRGDEHGKYSPLTFEVFQVNARIEWLIECFVANLESRAFSDSVVVGAPSENDGVSDRCIEGERNITKYSLGGCDNDGVRNTVCTRAA